MDNLNEIWGVLSRCDLTVNGDIVSKEPILQDQWKFLCELTKEDGKIGVILHTGSNAYNAVILLFCVLLTITNRSSDNKNTVKSLQKGDMVLYTDSDGKSERYLFEKISTEYSPILKKKVRFAVLIQNGTRRTERKLPEKLWGGISPYHGESSSLDGKGLKKTNSLRSEFYHSVLGMEAPNLVDASVIVLCSKQYYELIFDNCWVCFQNKKIAISDIATAAFYTDNTVIPHGGNAAKTEPMLKFTSSVEFARQESLQRNSNKLCGIVVLGEDLIGRNISQIPQIINLRRNPLFLTSVRIDSPYATDFETMTEKSILYYACTKKRLEMYMGNTEVPNAHTIEIQKQIEVSVAHKSEVIVINDIFQNTTYSSILEMIRIIKNDDFANSDKDTFIIICYSLVKLLTTAVFPLTELDDLISEKIIGTQSFCTRIAELNRLKEMFPQYLKHTAEIIIDGLCEASDRILNNNEKEEKLRGILAQYNAKKVAVLVNKGYFETVLSNRKIRLMINNLGEMTITTPNRLDLNKNYDAIITTSANNGNKFNPVECISAPIVYSILYRCELPYHSVLKKNHLHKLSVYNGCPTSDINREEYHKESGWLEEYHETDIDNIQVANVNKEIENFIHQINQKADIKQYIRMGGTTSSTVNTVVVATFENDSKAFFTKMYKAYVFSEQESSVNEVPAEDLREGDMVLFFRSSWQAKDLVKDILEHLIESGKVSPSLINSYEMSKRWKKDMWDYQEQHNMTDSQFAAELKLCGVSVQEITIKQWLDEDSHTVAPHDPENLKFIGKFTKDEELESKFLEYFNACREIRSLRKQILNYIGKAIVMRLIGERPEKDEVYGLIYNDIDNMSELLEVKHIIKANNIVPINMINRPLSI